MAMNSYVAHAFVLAVLLAVSLGWRRPRTVFFICLLGGELPVFLLAWTAEPYVSRAPWMLSVFFSACLIYIGCMAQLALDLAKKAYDATQR